MEETRKFSMQELATLMGKRANCMHRFQRQNIRFYSIAPMIEWRPFGSCCRSMLDKSMGIAPHNQDVLEKMRIVGFLV